MIRIATLACLLLLLAPAASRAGGKAATARALGAQMAAAGASSGALAVDLDTGETIYRLQADTPRMPASVEKLYTSATALERFGASGRLATTVYAETPPDAEGVVEGDLFLRGSGDPNLDVIDLGKLAQQVDDAGHHGHHRARDRRRVRVGHPSRRPLQRLRAHLRRRRALRADRQPRAHGQARPLLAAAAGEVQRERLREAAAPPRRRRPRLDPPRPHARRRGARRRLALGLHALARPPDEPAVGQLHRGDADQGDRGRRRRARHDLGGRRGDRGDAGQGVRHPAHGRRRLGPLAQRPHVAAPGRHDAPRRWPTSPRSSARCAVAGRTGTIYSRMRGTPAQDRCRAKTGTLRDVSALAGTA